MKNIKMFILSTLFCACCINVWAQTQLEVNKSDELECKKLFEQELFRRNILTKGVCLDHSAYPNISISLDNYNFKSASESKNFSDDKKASLNFLIQLVNNASQGIDGAKKELIGYSDGEKYVGDKYDERELGLERGDGCKKVTQKTIEYVKVHNLEEQVGVLRLGKDCLKSNARSLDVRLDILRNHALARNRIKDFCTNVGALNGSDCDRVAIGRASPELIRKAHENSDYKGICDERRGVLFNFIFPDEVRKQRTKKAGEFSPNYKIASRQLQNNMNFAASMDFMQQLSNLEDVDEDKKFLSDFDKNLSKRKFSKSNFFNKENDRKRFRKLLENSKCDQNEYQVDNARRKYWAIQRQLLKVESLASENDPETKEFIDAIQKGDYQGFMKHKEIINLASQNSIGIQYDYIGELKKKIKNKEVSEIEDVNFLNNDLNIEKILLARTLLLGVPIHRVQEDPNKVEWFRSGNVSVKMGKKNLPSSYKNYNRYDKSEFNINNNNYPASDIHACHDVSWALADFVTNTPDPNVLMPDLANGDEVFLDAKTIDKVSLNHRYGMPHTIANRLRAGNRKINNFLTEDESSRGWICKGCGSGVHVHENGEVHFISRSRVGNLGDGQNKIANMTPVKFLGAEDINIATLQSLKSFEIGNCKDCDCLRGLSGDELKTILKGESDRFPSRSFSMIKSGTDDQHGVIDSSKNKYEVKYDNACIFSPPVPHSCSFDPIGESEENLKAREAKDSLYCSLYSKLKEMPAYESERRLNEDSEYEDYKKSCSEKIFPMSEQDCLEHSNLQKSNKLNKASNATKN